MGPEIALLCQDDMGPEEEAREPRSSLPLHLPEVSPGTTIVHAMEHTQALLNINVRLHCLGSVELGPQEHKSMVYTFAPVEQLLTPPFGALLLNGSGRNTPPTL